MKVFLVSFLLLFSIPGVFCQKLVGDKQPTFQSPAADSVIFLKVYLKDNRTGAAYRLRVQDFNQGSANFGTDYTLVNPLQHTSPFQFIDSFPITLKPYTGEEDRRTVILQIKALSDDTTLSTRLELTMKNRALTEAEKKEKKKREKALTDRANRTRTDTIFASLSLLTAASFDFFGQSTFGKYAGNLNAHVPHIMGRLGFNGGISHLHYYRADSSSGNLYTANVLLNPSATRLTDTTKYRAAIYALNSRTEIRTWSYYGQVLWHTGINPIPEKDAISRFYATAHFEVFTMDGKTTFSVDSIQNRIETFDSTRDHRKVFSLTGGTRPKEIVSRKINGYFGLGGTWIGNYPNKFSLFSQVVFGVTTERPSNLEEISQPKFSDASPKIVTSYRLTETKANMAWFYLVRTQLVEKYTKLNGTIGVDIRGLFPTYSPLIAAYLGVQLKFDNFFK